MKTWKFISCMVLLLSLPAFAGVKEGRITSILVLTSIPDRAFIKVAGSYLQSEPSCATGTTEFDFIFDITTVTGKALYALAVANHATGTIVTVGGLGSCSLRLGYEDLDYIQIKQ